MAISTQLAVLADAASLSREGKLNIFGEFNMIWWPAEPIQWPLMWYVAKLRSSEADGHEINLQLRVVDEDEGLIAGPVGITLRIGPPVLAGVGNAMPLFVPIANAVFPRFGTYEFVLATGDGKEIQRTPLHIAPASKMPQAPQ